MNYFEFYQIPVSFKIDVALLKRKYFEFSKKYHPDFFSQSNELEKENALEFSTLNTNAFNTLSDFDKRMKYILQQKNYLQPYEKFDLPKDFLMEMMELNEAIMEGDNLENCKTQIAIFEKNIFTKVEVIFNADDLNNATDKNFEEVKEFYFKKKYLLRLKEQITNAQ